MKRLYYIATLAIALFASLPIQAQEEAGNTQQQQQRRRGPEASRGAREERERHARTDRPSTGYERANDAAYR